MEKSGEINSINMLQNFNTKERSVNFCKEEVIRLQTLVEKYKNILMCKKTDGSSTKQKEYVWSSIEKEFNATGQIPRTMKQLKYKFENMKRSAKKEASSLKGTPRNETYRRRQTSLAPTRIRRCY
ncbi:hypothetical protein evm_012727 [Chilo suppressalis]|nr:hypothetical protein evm_012727 [Chilo suppressalis]